MAKKPAVSPAKPTDGPAEGVPTVLRLVAHAGNPADEARAAALEALLETGFKASAAELAFAQATTDEDKALIQKLFDEAKAAAIVARDAVVSMWDDALAELAKLKNTPAKQLTKGGGNSAASPAAEETVKCFALEIVRWHGKRRPRGTPLILAPAAFDQLSALGAVSVDPPQSA